MKDKKELKKEKSFLHKAFLQKIPIFGWIVLCNVPFIVIGLVILIHAPSSLKINVQERHSQQTIAGENMVITTPQSADIAPECIGSVSFKSGQARVDTPCMKPETSRITLKLSQLYICDVVIDEKGHSSRGMSIPQVIEKGDGYFIIQGFCGEDSYTIDWEIRNDIPIVP